MTESASVRRHHVADDILTRSAALFDQLGYGSTSLQDIADAVGVARSSIYHYFPSKEQILATLVDRASDQREAIVSEIGAMTTGPLARLDELLFSLGRTIASNPIGLRLALNEGASLPAAVQQRSIRSRRQMFELLASILEAGVDSGEVRPLDARQAAATIIAALSGLQYGDVGGVHMDPPVAARQLTRMITDGIRQAPDRRVSTLADALDRLRADLDVVEHQVRRERADPHDVDG
jgi:AcrR family transcriptional regulator